MSGEIVYWTTKDGTKINVDNMDIYHLRVVLKMVIKNINKAKAKAKESFELQGDIAQQMQEAYELEDYDLGDDPTWDIYAR